MMDKKIQNIMLVILLVLIPTGSLLFYFNYSIKIAKQDYEAKISDLSKKTAENLQDLGVRIDALGANLSSQIGFVDASLRSFKKQNQQEIKTLSDLIDEIERQSDIRLSELKNELKDIRIKSADFSAIVDDVLQSVVSVQTNVGQGSGAIIDAKGYIVTNVHVISGASTIKALTYSGKTYNAILIGMDTAVDIAVLKVDAANLKSLGY